MKNNERGNDKMLKLLLFGLGAAVVAGGAYILYKSKQQQGKKRQSNSLIQRKEENYLESPEEVCTKNTETVKEPVKEPENPELTEKLKDECWELYKESFSLEKTTEYYTKAFLGNGILYYTQRLLGLLFIDKIETEKRIVNIIDNIESSLDVLEYNIESSKTKVPFTKQSFFENRVGNINRENLESKIQELGEIVNRLKASANYTFLDSLYKSSKNAYYQLAELVKEEAIISQYAQKAGELVSVLDKNNLKIVYYDDLEPMQKEKLFNTNPDASPVPAIVDKSDNRIILKGNCN